MYPSVNPSIHVYILTEKEGGAGGGGGTNREKHTYVQNSITTCLHPLKHEDFYFCILLPFVKLLLTKMHWSSKAYVNCEKRGNIQYNPIIVDQ